MDNTAINGNSGIAGVGEDDECVGDVDGEDDEVEVASTVPLTSVAGITSDVPPLGAQEASVLDTVKDDCPALVTVNVKVPMVPLPLKAPAGLYEVATR